MNQQLMNYEFNFGMKYQYVFNTEIIWFHGFLVVDGIKN